MSLLIAKAKLMEIIYEEIEEALRAGWETIYDDPEDPEERTGDLPAMEPLRPSLPPKEEPDPYPIHPSTQAMAVAMDWYQGKYPEKYKNFIREKGPQEELDRTKRAILRAAREVDAARSKPPAYEPIHHAATEPLSGVAEGAILRKYIKEELEAYLAEEKKYKKSFYKAKEKKADEIMASGTDKDDAYGIADTIVSKQGKKKKKKGNKK